MLVLVGEKTYCRKHVDWEIYAGLYKNAGLIALALPTHSSYKNNKYDDTDVPLRLYDNLKSEYASFYDWTEDQEKIIRWIEKAFEDKESKKENKDNSRIQMKNNRCS